MTEIADGRHIDVLKPEYFRLDSNGLLTQLNANFACNGYSDANAALIKAHSSQQFVTVSGSIAGITTLVSNAALMSTCIATLVTLVKRMQFTGIELDIEDFAAWTSAQYAEYKTFVTSAGNAFHAAGLQFMLDGPAILNQTYQSYYRFKYEDFNTLPVDYLVAMCYDFMYDDGAGKPVASLSTIVACCAWMQHAITNAARIVIGLNSYGYHGVTGGYSITEDTYEHSAAYTGFSSAVRDVSSGEMMWEHNGVSYNYSDAHTISTKLQAVDAANLSAVSIWHIGGKNPWPIQVAAPIATPAAPTSPSTSVPVDLLLATFDAKYPGFSAWYQAHFDGQGQYHA